MVDQGLGFDLGTLASRRSALRFVGLGAVGGARHLATVTGDMASGYRVALAVGVDTTTEPAGGPGGPRPSR